ncbi:MAG: hypothetical protein ACYS0I_04140 [Planctomycetota bacterium]|jgi:hypothetical protein
MKTAYLKLRTRYGYVKEKGKKALKNLKIFLTILNLIGHNNLGEARQSNVDYKILPWGFSA